jgi:hypothetical protein
MGGARRLLVGAAALSVAAQSILAGCTLLITFDEAADAGVDASFPPRPDATPDVVASDVAVDAPNDTKPPDAGVDVLGLDACAGQLDGQYCGNNRLVGYPNKDDLVVCANGKIVSVRTCTKGVGCIHLPDPQADECDECQGRANGYYCGRQLTGWKAENANVQVRCMNGSEVSLKVCTTCTNGSQTVCP